MRGTCQSLNAVLFASLIVLSVMGVTNAVFTYSGAADYLWAIMGLLVVERRV